MPGNTWLMARCLLVFSRWKRPLARRSNEGEMTMRWDDFRRSSNVEDERGDGGGGGFGMPGGAHGLGIGTIIILGLVGWALGIDPSVLINGAQILSGGGAPTQQSGPPPADDARTAETKDFIAAVLGDTEDRWKDIFTAMGRTYHPVRLRLYDGAIDGGCGMAQAAMGPFYCPQDKDIYLDMSFFRDMQDK